MPIRQNTPTRTACMQARLDLIDAAATPGKIQFMSGGQADPWADITSIPAHAVSTAYTAGNYVTVGLHYYRAETSGTSAGAAPSWPTDGSTVADNDITWQDMGGIPVRLGTLTMSQPAGTVTDGTLTFDPITEDAAADTNGTCTWARITDGDDNPVMDLPVGEIGSGQPIQINTTNIVQGGPLRITSAVLTEGGQ